MKRSLVIVSILLTLLLALALAAGCSGASTPTKITVVTAPNSVKVVQGQAPDLTGGVVEIVFENGSSKEFPMSEMEVEGLKNDVLGTQTVALIYSAKGKTVSTAIDLTVVAPKVLSLMLSLDGVKTDYIEGDNFDKTGLVVTANYETGASGEIKVYEISPRTLTTDTTAVKVTYRGATAEIPVTVSAHAPQSIRIVTPPDKTSYYIGESFDPAGLSLSVTYNDGTQDTFLSGDLSYFYSVGQSEYGAPLSLSDDVVRVVANTRYGKIGVQIRLTLTEIVPIRLTLLSSKEDILVFDEGDLFSFFDEEEAITVKVTYNNGREETVVADSDRFAYSEETLRGGQTSIDIYPEGYPAVTASVPISVLEPTVLGISILNDPYKVEYLVGESVDLTGLVLELRLSNGSYSSLEYDAESGIEPASATIAAEQRRITVHYLDFSASFEISIAES